MVRYYFGVPLNRFVYDCRFLWHPVIVIVHQIILVYSLVNLPPWRRALSEQIVTSFSILSLLTG